MLKNKRGRKIYPTPQFFQPHNISSDTFLIPTPNFKEMKDTFLRSLLKIGFHPDRPFPSLLLFTFQFVQKTTNASTTFSSAILTEKGFTVPRHCIEYRNEFHDVVT